MNTKKRCSMCKKLLNKTEIEYYGTKCERCEGILNEVLCREGNDFWTVIKLKCLCVRFFAFFHNKRNRS